jgi:hypothetical protein
VPAGGRFFYAVNALGKFIRTPLAKNSKFSGIDVLFLDSLFFKLLI